MTFQEYIYLKLSAKVGNSNVDSLFNKVDKNIPESIYEIIWKDGYPIDLRLIDLFKIEKRENKYLIYRYACGFLTPHLMSPHRLIIFSMKNFVNSQKFSSAYGTTSRS